MKTLALIGIALCFVGCAINRTDIHSRSLLTNGVVEEKRLVNVTTAFWPATSTIEKQKASLSPKSINLGSEGIKEDSGGTNVVEALRSIDSILGKIR